MKTVVSTILTLLISATQVLAFGNKGNGEGLGVLSTFIVTFGLLIILFQLLPGFMLFSEMIKGLFYSDIKKQTKRNYSPTTFLRHLN